MIETDTRAVVEESARPRRRVNAKFVIGGVIVLATIVYLVLSAARGSAAYYLTVDELLQRGSSASTVRVAGAVVPGSIVWKETELFLSFQVADDSGALPAIYHGPRPDMFRDDAEVVIEGQYGADGVFTAQTLMLKCPSKYEEATPNG